MLVLAIVGEVEQCHLNIMNSHQMGNGVVLQMVITRGGNRGTMNEVLASRWISAEFSTVEVFTFLVLCLDF